MNRLHLKQWPQVSSRFWVRSGFALALGIMAGVGTAAFWALSQQIESAEWLDYSHLLVNELARLETLRTDADVQLQNYLQSGDRNDEATYQDTLQLAQAQLETLQSDTPDNRRHQEWLQRIEQWMGDHTKLASQAIQLRQSNSLQPERQQQLLLQRAILQQKMHRLEAQMIQDIQRDLNEWSTDSSIIARQLQWLTAFGTLVGLDLLVIVNSWLRQAIRNRQQAEQSLWELNRTLEETLQQKTVDLDRMAAAWHTLEQEKEVIDLKLRFFSLASHELRTPLSTILMSAQLLKQAPDWPLEKRERNLDRIQSAARTLLQLLVDMLTLSRAEAGKLEFNPQPLDIPEFCDRLIDEVKGNLNTAPFIKLHIEGSDNVALLDEKLLRAILINLLLNAAKYSPEESEIGLRVECSVGKTVFKVSDRGIGIPAADQQYLYDSFHRGENVGTLPGTGLGLAVVKKCLERHGGNIQVQSEVGVGTTFRVTIPWTTTEVTL